MWTLRRATLPFGSGLATLVLIAALAGCSSRPENSPVIRTKFKELAELQQQVGDLSVQMKQLTAEMSAFRRDMTEMSGTVGSSDTLSRLDEMSQRLTALDEVTKQLAQSLTAAEKSRQIASAKPAAASEASERSKGSGGAVTIATPAKRSTASAATRSEPAKTKGRYYTIKSGDTPESIARAHGIALDSLLRANRLPSNATVFPGQQIFVPGS